MSMNINPLKITSQSLIRQNEPPIKAKEPTENNNVETNSSTNISSKHVLSQYKNYSVSFGQTNKTKVVNDNSFLPSDFIEKFDKVMANYDSKEHKISLTNTDDLISIEKNPELETSLRKLFKVFPQFLQTIERPNSNGQKLIEHILDVYKETIQTDEFAQLKDDEKQILRYSALFHDLEKDNKIENGKITFYDFNHPEKSADKAYDLLKEKTDLSDESLTSIKNVIANHHFTSRLSRGHSTETDIAQEFSNRPNDFKLITTLVKGDILAGKQSFIIEKLENEIPAMFGRITDILNNL